MAFSPFTLSAAIAALGVAEVFTGDPFTAQGGMLSLGAVEGTVEVSPAYTTNPLTAPELTGDVAHQMTTTLGNVTVRIPLIISSMAVIPKISPTGVASGGHSVPQKVQETTVVIIPRAQVGGGLSYPTAGPWARLAGNGVGALSGAGAEPTNAIWFWRATPTYTSLPFSYGNGGKVIVEVTFTAMWYSGAAAVPEGHKVFTIGDPRAVTPTPIPVLI